MNRGNLTMALSEQAARLPTRLALIHKGQEYDFAWLDRAIWRMAARLAAGGVMPGKVCGLLFASPMALLLSQLAVARLGATLVHLTLLETETYQCDLLVRAGASLLLTDVEASRGLVAVASPLLLLDSLDPSGGPGLEPPIDFALLDPTPQAPWILLLGSGSTGGTKLLPLSHAVALGRGEMYGNAYGWEPSDRLACLTPLEMGFGAIRTAMALCRGGSVVLLDRHQPPDPEGLRRQGVTLLLGGVSHAEQLLDLAAPGDQSALAFLRVLLLGGSTVTDTLRRRITKQLTPNLYVNYGCQECGPITMSRPDEPTLPGSVGRPIKGADVRIVDGAGQPVPPGESGLILVRSPGMIEGYLDDPEATARCFEDGWFSTGDMGQIAADGQLIHHGRADHMMIFDGLNIFPTEVENVMATFPAIEDVACVPLRSDTHQDVPLCVVSFGCGQVPALSELHRFALDRLGPCRPRQFIVLPSIPRSITGKLNRRRLYEEIEKVMPGARGHGGGQPPRAWREGPPRSLPEQGLERRFEQQVACTPHAIALIAGDESLTYAELEARANRLAHLLGELGIGPQSIVGICLERSTAMVVALLAILKAGGAYLPMEACWPGERWKRLIADAAVPLILTDLAQRDRLPETTARLLFVDDPVFLDALEGRSKYPLSLPDDPRRLAYLLFTSGSTGIPKGVLIEHRSILRLVEDHEPLAIRPGERVLQLAPLAFDAATYELWGALLNGATLVLAPPGPPDLAELARLLAERAITNLWLTAALFHLMVDEQSDALAGVRTVLAGGDVLSPAHVHTLLERFPPGHRLVNGYGPTEATTFTSCHVMEAGDKPGDGGGGAIPIGRPIAGTSVHVLDSEGQPCPIGILGELHIGGIGLARGYLNNPELTAETFIPDPFSSDPNARIYRSGDLVSWNHDGTLAFHGRLDDQIKLRGFRIEPGEIEAALLRHPAIARVAVISLPAASGDPRLVAYWVRAGHASISSVDGLDGVPCTDEESLRGHLGASLPQPMVPSAFMELETLPLGANGKLDRQALPAPGPAHETTHAPPASPLDRQLHTIWAEVLGHNDFGPHDDFFQLGGHSLAAARLVARINDVFGCTLPVTALLQAPTLEQLARRVGGDGTVGEDQSGRSLVALQPAGGAAPLFVIHGYGGGVLGYTGFARSFAPDRPVYGLQALGRDGSRPLHTCVEEMAAHYSEEILSQWPQGPYHLMGNSAGGWYAHAVARALLDRGGSIGMVIILDSGSTAFINRRLRASLLFRKVLQRLPSEVRQIPWSQPWGLARHLTRRFRRLKRHVRGFRAPGKVARRSVAGASSIDGSKGGLEDYFAAVHRAYRPAILPVAVHLFTTPKDAQLKLRLWSAHSSVGITHEILFEHHYQYYQAEWSAVLAAAVRQALETSEGKGLGPWQSPWVARQSCVQGGMTAKSVKPLEPLVWQPTATHRADGRTPGPIPPAPGEACPLVLRIDRTAQGTIAAFGLLEAFLAPEERLRLARLRRLEDRERFLLGRGVLRQVLAHWLNREPGSLTFSTGPCGKPALAEGGGPRFNVAHSGDLVLLGFHPSREVGVDVEQLRPQLDWQRIARRCFPAEQCLRLERLPTVRQLPAFLEAWCRLEADLKARGVGLSWLDQAHLDGTRSTAAVELWSIALPVGYFGAAALV